MKQESNRQKTMEDIDGGLHPAVDKQSLGEGEDEQIPNHATFTLTRKPSTLECVVPLWHCIDVKAR